MLSYVIKRVLLMIPTFLGVSIVIWLVMTFAPGEPASGDSQGGFGADISEGSQDRDRTNLNQRLFRQQFALDRPRLLNTWTGLDADDLRAELQVFLDAEKEARSPSLDSTLPASARRAAGSMTGVPTPFRPCSRS